MQKHHSGLQIYNQKQWDRAVVQKRTWTRWRWLARAESRAAAARSTAEHFFLRQLLLCCSPPQRSRHPQRSRSRHPQPHPAAAAAAMPLVDAHPTPLMRIEDVLGKEAANLPLRVAKSLGDIKTMPMPYDLLPPEMRAKDVHERHERRKKMALHTVNSTSLLHWTWEPTMSDLEISTEATQRKPRRKKRRPKKPVRGKPALLLQSASEKTEMLCNLQERQVAERENQAVAIEAERSARDLEINAATFTPATRPLPEFYNERLFLEEGHKPGASRVDCRRRRKKKQKGTMVSTHTHTPPQLFQGRFLRLLVITARAGVEDPQVRMGGTIDNQRLIGSLGLDPDGALDHPSHRL